LTEAISVATGDLAHVQSLATAETSNLDDDMVKLVAYTIVCLRYEDEHVVAIVPGSTSDGTLDPGTLRGEAPSGAAATSWLVSARTG